MKRREAHAGIRGNIPQRGSAPNCLNAEHGSRNWGLLAVAGSKLLAGERQNLERK